MLTTLKTVGKWNGTTRGYNELKRFVEYFANESLLFLLFFFFKDKTKIYLSINLWMLSEKVKDKN